MSYVQTLLLNLIILFSAPASLLAGPILLCNPYPLTELQPTGFVVVFDGGADLPVLPQQYPDGSSRLWYDLGEIADGIHTVKVKAVNSVVKSAGSALPLESAWVAISFRKTGSQIVRVKDDAEKLPPTRTFKGYIRDER
jgi:hypothetical protein